MTAATGISIILVPPSISAVVYSLLSMEYQHGELFHRIIVWLVAVLCSGGFQILYILYLRRERRLTAYDVPERAQRTRPYLISAGISLAGLVALLFLHASLMLSMLMLCFTINTIIVMTINLRWKISAHMMGLAGSPMFLIPIFGWFLLLALPLLTALGWARMRLGAHTLAQVVAGAVLGAGLTLVELVAILTWAAHLL